MQPFGLTSVSLGAITASLITVRGIKRKSLSPSGALTAWLVGFVSISCGLRGFVLFMFYQVSPLIPTSADMSHYEMKSNTYV